MVLASPWDTLYYRVAFLLLRPRLKDTLPCLGNCIVIFTSFDSHIPQQLREGEDAGVLENTSWEFPGGCELGAFTSGA